MNGTLRLAILLVASMGICGGAVADDWQLAKNEDGIKVYLKDVPGSKYKSFRGVIDIKADVQTLNDLQENLRVACKWLYACKELRLLKNDGDDTWVYMTLQLPWPVISRDMVIHVNTQRTDNGGLVRSLNAVPGYMPPVQGQIRVPELIGQWTMSPRSNGTTEVIYQMRGEPGGSVPPWLSNSFVVDAPMETLRTLRAVAERQPTRASYP
ncbi:START domain-containing protein [Pseudomonas schmalbachii]|uniref:START domain-containing protein n=1 Tax=Pseudomonas schmalbachii TaxID=2816993 RepID=A0ABS3TXC7_9PSED|nr:START domain-containing protein [Pseudomonas schmalbachii]MBO3277305.1 START domain-containing protein [Pseudomonas schmalbachii]